MGWTEAPRTYYIPIVSRQIETELIVRDGELVFGNTNMAGVRVPVHGGTFIVRVGCH